MASDSRAAWSRRATSGRCETGAVIPSAFQCVFCGASVAYDDETASSFLFLARRGSEFCLVNDWLETSAHLEGSQYYCHASCFTAAMDPTVRRALTDDE